MPQSRLERRQGAADHRPRGMLDDRAGNRFRSQPEGMMGRASTAIGNHSPAGGSCG